MSECCHACGRPFPPKVYTIDDAQQLFEILAAQPDGYVYVSNSGTWHVTRTRGMVSPALVETLRVTGDLHNLYKGKDHMAYTLASRPQIDLEARAAERRARNASPAAKREYQRRYYQSHRGKQAGI